MIQNTSHTEEGHGNLLVLALLALIVGAAAGFVGAMFRLTLQQADHLRDALIDWAQGEKLAGFLIVVATSAAASGRIAGGCLRPVRVPALLPRSTLHWRARFSCSRSLCVGLSSISRSRRWERRPQQSRWRACFSVMRLISMWRPLPIPAS